MLRNFIIPLLVPLSPLRSQQLLERPGELLEPDRLLEEGVLQPLIAAAAPPTAGEELNGGYRGMCGWKVEGTLRCRPYIAHRVYTVSAV